MQNNAHRTLGIDPGFDRAGVAILEGTSSEQRLIYSECIETNKTASHEDRLKQIGLRVRDVIREFSPSSLAIEKLFFNQNTSTALKVAEARGVIMFEAAAAGIPVFEYSPQAVKIAVTGYGKAGKKDVEHMTIRLLNLRTKPKRDDETDAIAVAITHLASAKSQLSPRL